MSVALQIVAAAWLFGAIVAMLFAVSTVALGPFAPRLSVPMFWFIVNWSAAALIALSIVMKGGA